MRARDRLTGKKKGPFCCACVSRVNVDTRAYNELIFVKAYFTRVHNMSACPIPPLSRRRGIFTDLNPFGRGVFSSFRMGR